MLIHSAAQSAETDARLFCAKFLGCPDNLGNFASDLHQNSFAAPAYQPFPKRLQLLHGDVFCSFVTPEGQTCSMHQTGGSTLCLLVCHAQNLCQIPPFNKGHSYYITPPHS